MEDSGKIQYHSNSPMVSETTFQLQFHNKSNKFQEFSATSWAKQTEIDDKFMLSIVDYQVGRFVLHWYILIYNNIQCELL